MMGPGSASRSLKRMMRLLPRAIEAMRCRQGATSVVPDGFRPDRTLRIVASCERLLLGGRKARIWVSNVTRPTGSCWWIMR